MGQNNSDYVVTTRPINPPYEAYPVLATSNPRVFLRPYHVDDLNDLHELRSQIEVMKWTSAGKVDADIDQTRTWMNRFMQVEDDLSHTAEGDLQEKVKNASISPINFCFVIVFREDSHDEAATTSSTEKVIGAAGCHVLNPEAECGYMIRKEYWGQGIATAVLRAYLDFYWKLERRNVRAPRRKTISEATQSSPIPLEDTQEDVTVREQLWATIVQTNIGSRRVLEKCGFQYGSSEVVPENGEELSLDFYCLTRP